MGFLEALGLKYKEEEEDEMFGKRERLDYNEDMVYGEEPFEDVMEDEDPYYEERQSFFSRNKERASAPKAAPASSMSQDPSKVRVLIYKPLSYEDTQNIIDNLKEKKSIVVNLDDLEIDVAQRILDFISGAVYALNGSIRKAARNIFVIAPFNVDVSSNSNEMQDEYSFGDR